MTPHATKARSEVGIIDKASIWDAPDRCRQTEDRRRLVFVVVMVIFGLMLFVAYSRPVLSQGIALIKVDVNVVAQGYRASKLIGSGVVNDKNDKIGSLDDIIIDKKNVLFAVLQVGGFLGVGGRLVAVPYDSLKIDEAGKRIELPGASKDELNKLGEFKYRT